MSKIKSRIREESLEKRDALTQKEVREKSSLIKERFFNLKEFKDAKLIMFYASFRNEVRTQEMIEDAIRIGKKTALPVTLEQDRRIKPYFVHAPKKDLIAGRFGIPEPKINNDREVDTKEIDMIVIPGVAFDKKGGRIGFGRGFYDRFLHSLRARKGEPYTRPFCVGLGFEIQVVDTIPREDYDEKVDAVITEDQVYAAE